MKTGKSVIALPANDIQLRETDRLRLPQTTFIKVFRSAKTQQKPHIDRVYSWACRWVAENMGYRLDESYYWTEPAKRLLYKLEHVKCGFIGLVGLQGVGKTTTLAKLYVTLRDKKPEHVSFVFWRKEAYDSWDFRKIKRKFKYGPFRSEPEKREQFERENKILFIDMGDYSKAGRSSMNKHLDQIRELWFKTRNYNVTIIVSIQKELFSGHFLFGKIDAVELEPLKPEQLVEAYKGFWHTSEPFTSGALLLLAQLSRGIFRRFMKYIQACIERYVITEVKQERIGIELVNETVTFDQLVKDMDLELSDIFKRSEQKLEVVKLLDFLRQNNEANQKQIAEGVGISEPTVSRLMQKLEAHGYVIRKRDIHGQWLTRLRF